MGQEHPFKNMQEKLPPHFFRKLKWGVIGFIALIFLFTTWFTIAPEEVGVVLRFGKFVRTVDPGLNFKLPFGLETVEKVPVERQLKMEFGFRTTSAGIRTEYSTANYDEESLMLTGDLNAADVQWIAQFRIIDPFKYLFRVRNAVKTFRDMNEATMREIVGDRTVNEVLTIGRQEIEKTVLEQLQVLCDQYESGIKVEQIVLQDVNPPGPVKPSFNKVNEAQQEKEKLINQAWSEYNKIIPRAKGEASKVIEEARGYALERVNKAQGEASKFQSIYREYINSPEVTRQRIYLETMNKVLQKSGKKLISDDKTGGILPLFQYQNKGAKP